MHYKHPLISIGLAHPTQDLSQSVHILFSSYIVPKGHDGMHSLIPLLKFFIAGKPTYFILSISKQFIGRTQYPPKIKSPSK